MKITNNFSLLSPLLTQDDSNNQKKFVQTDVKNMEEHSVELSISDEGLVRYRSSVQQNNQESLETVLERREQLEKTKVMQYGYDLEMRAVERNDQAAKSGKFLSSADRANGYVRAYAELYDEIVQGYENGTREIYVQNEYGVHKLTKEEELGELHAAYTRLVDDFVTREKANQQAHEIVSEEMKKIAKISSKSTMAMDYLEEQETEEAYKVPENLHDLMMNAVASFKQQYAMLNPNTRSLSQLLSGLKI